MKHTYLLHFVAGRVKCYFCHLRPDISIFLSVLVFWWDPYLNTHCLSHENYLAKSVNERQK